MHCFACDILLGSQTTPDPRTGRFYCEPCMEFANQVILSQDRKAFMDNLVGTPSNDLFDLLDTPNDPDDLDEILAEFERDHPLDQETKEELDNYYSEDQSSF